MILGRVHTIPGSPTSNVVKDESYFPYKIFEENDTTKNILEECLYVEKIF